jgi:hypothetical protein
MSLPAQIAHRRLFHRQLSIEHSQIGHGALDDGAEQREGFEKADHLTASVKAMASLAEAERMRKVDDWERRR